MWGRRGREAHTVSHCIISPYASTAFLTIPPLISDFLRLYQPGDLIDGRFISPSAEVMPCVPRSNEARACWGAAYMREAGYQQPSIMLCATRSRIREAAWRGIVYFLFSKRMTMPPGIDDCRDVSRSFNISLTASIFSSQQHGSRRQHRK